MMGLPIGRFICASNKNNVLTDFINTGVYDKNREFYKTSSPSMDILISSNVERLLYVIAGAEKTASYMKSLNETGGYTLSPEDLSAVQSVFSADHASEEETAATIGKVYKEYSYLSDTHTAVALSASLKRGGKVLTVSTASPYKFSEAVLSAIGGASDGGVFGPLDALHRMTGVPVPVPLSSLREKKVRFEGAIKPSEMRESL